MKKYILAILVIIFPYSIPLVVYFISSETLMDTVFHYNVFYCIIFILILGLIALIASISICVLGYLKKWTQNDMALINMIIKLAQIPAYIAIFILGFIFLLTIFTYGFVIAFIIFDILAILISGLIGVTATVKNYSHGNLTKIECIIYSISQFVFCIDIVSAIILYRKSKIKLSKY